MEQSVQFNIVKSMKKMQSAYFYSLFLFSSSLVLLILHLMKSYSGVYLTSILKFNIDRNHVFLICNGILVILVKSSSSLSMSSSQDSNSDYSSSTSNAAQSLPRPVVLGDQRKQQEEFSAVSSEQNVATDVKTARFLTVEETVITEVLQVQHQKVVVSECEVAHVHQQNDDDVYDDHNDIVDDDEEEDDEEAEELNKRCEDFIRKMKQGIISEHRNDLGLARNYIC
ncbi:uncharacterized protein LOC110730741 [Chenopodium quinoa]|uniref:uncharacterized protein LOC110730741 n=1 Tax=Chenopodium quinoa TaxID=63459 RepID=UPI000B7955BD|nr:uncharacterized protein LOC110730741 [Chenopodium quinoa]